MGDTWTYVGGDWHCIPGTSTNSPAARHGARMVFDPDCGAIVLHGGEDGTTMLT